MLIDTHAHLNFNAYKNDADEVIRRSLNNNVWMINVGSQYETSKRAVEITEKYPKGVYAAVGLHPIHLEKRKFESEVEEFDYQKYEELTRSEKVVAIGEIGLDYYYKPKTKKKLELFKEKQKTILLKQLELAQELNLPVIFHCRMAHQDLIEILKAHSGVILHSQRQTHSLPEARSGALLRLPGVIHCFTGTWEQAVKYLEMGFYLGFNGIIFKNIEGINFDKIIKKTPLEKILIETDCPYLTPPQIEGRNEPIYLKYIAEKIAKIKNVSFEKIAKVTTQNAKNLFKLF